LTISVFDIFKIGVGPSSSHTVGPMRAAREFVTDLERQGLLERTAKVAIQLYGSLALTGKGHGTDRAVLLGLMGETPDGVDPEAIESKVAAVRASQELPLLGRQRIAFDEPLDLLYLKTEVLPQHSNGMRYTAFDASGARLHAAEYYSIGGGFVVRGGEDEARTEAPAMRVPHDFGSGAELMAMCGNNALDIAGLMLANEAAWRPEAETRAGVARIWAVMEACIERGMRVEGILPGGLNVKRRAAALAHELRTQTKPNPLDVMDWVNCYALAVNEENAAGGRVVTAPTNGAAGIIPAVIMYYKEFVEGADARGIERFLLTAAAIGILYKKNASISGAEMGCQGEVGVACSMAAAGLAAAQGGSVNQVENAAEIGMEHNLGLTCDPVAGLVQIPCIERNAIGAVKAINAARMALRGDGTHKVSLDQVIRTMRQTGLDMQTKYKETSLGGLAVNVIEC
jgi:L-serine dehydratase